VHEGPEVRRSLAVHRGFAALLSCQDKLETKNRDRNTVTATASDRIHATYLKEIEKRPRRACTKIHVEEVPTTGRLGPTGAPSGN